MSDRIRLTRDSGRRWTRVGQTWVKGHAFDANGQLLAGNDLAESVGTEPNDLPARVSGLNGEFAVVVQNEDRTAAGADQIRSIPLFYAERDGHLVVGDDALALARLIGAPVADDADLAFFLLQGCVSGSGTLAKGVYQIRAGECVVSDRRCSRTSTFLFGSNVDRGWDFPNDADREASISRGVALIDDMVDRCLKSIGDRPLAVPLSGGLDSRLIAAMLARKGRTDTLCYTYGRRGSFDTTVSREIARLLGLRWKFIPYTNSSWKRWGRLESYREFRTYASQLSAIEHEQDWPAVRELLRQGDIQDNAVVVPGHSGDFLAGSHLPVRAFEPGANPSASAWISDKYLRLWPDKSISPSLRESITAQLERVLSEPDLTEQTDIPSALRVFDHYGWRERQTKMIVNSLRVYEDHGLDWRIPLWDREWAEYWDAVPIRARRDRTHALKILRRCLGSLMDVPYAPKPMPRFLERSGRVTDVNYRRYGLYLGSFPLLHGLRRRLKDLSDGGCPIVREFLKPVENHIPQRLPLNALTALFQLEDSIAAIQR
jgi:asparagine synthase (glutamine-hydrolysing)